MGDVKAMVDAKIAGKRVMVFSKSYCPYCTKAKKVLAEYNLSPEEYEVLEMENRGDCDQIQDYLKSLTGYRSVPRVFIQGKCIGGGDETTSLHKSGQLKKLLGK